MTWRDAPIVGRPVARRPSWMDAPLVGEERPEDDGEDYGLSNVVPVGFGLPGISEEALAATAGAVKGTGNTALGVVRAARAAGVPLVGRIPQEAMDYAGELVRPHGGMETLGRGAEQVAEFAALPGPAKVRGAARALELAKSGAAAASLTGIQGGGPAEMAVTAAGGPLVAGVGALAGKVAAPMVRSAIKPTVSAMKRVAGASIEGIEAKAGQLVNFILENRVTTADKARKILTDAEHELQRILAVKNAPTDAATRAVHYLGALEKSAAKQGIPGDDVALIKSATRQLLEGPMGEDVTKLVPGKGPGSIGGLTPEVSRAARAEVPAAEALESARASSRWTTRKAWGEQKGATTEAAKAVERAQRDAVKAAVPEAVPLLQRQGQAIRAADALDRMEFRQANREAVGLPAHAIAAGEVATGRLPVLALATNILRNRGLQLGVWAGRLSKAVQEGNAAQTAFILSRLGISVSPAMVQPPGAR